MCLEKLMDAEGLLDEVGNVEDGMEGMPSLVECSYISMALLFVFILVASSNYIRILSS